MTRLEQFVKELNREPPILVSAAHVLIKAVGRVLALHPEFNSRILGRRLYRFKDINVLTALRHFRERRAEVVLLRNVSDRPLSEIAQELWQHYHDAARGEFIHAGLTRLYRRLPSLLRRHLLRFQVWTTPHGNTPAWEDNERQKCSPVLVNYLGFEGAAPMRAFVPSRLPIGAYTLNVTMGPTERRPVVTEDGHLEIRPVAPFFVRADHRFADAFELGRFTQTLRGLLGEPRQLEVKPAELVQPQSSLA
jgi:hypothetical protein